MKSKVNFQELAKELEKENEVLTVKLIQELVETKGMDQKALIQFAKDGFRYDRKKNSFVLFDAFEPQIEQMKTELAVNWTKEDQARVSTIRELLGLATEITIHLEGKIPLEYLDRKIENQNEPAANAIIALASRIEDALDEILDFQNAIAEREA